METNIWCVKRKTQKEKKIELFWNGAKFPKYRKLQKTKIERRDKEIKTKYKCIEMMQRGCTENAKKNGKVFDRYKERAGGNKQRVGDWEEKGEKI